MEKPSIADYVRLIQALFDRFIQAHPAQPKRGHPFLYKNRSLLVFFTLRAVQGIPHFKTQHRWLKTHPQHHQILGFETIPDRTTLSRRYKALYTTVQELVAFVGQDMQDLEAGFGNAHLSEDKSLFKAAGPVWHQSDRKAGRVPEHLRRLDQDASWSKSAYHGWGYGYGLHLTCAQSGFPKLVQVETGSVSESQVIDAKEASILDVIGPATLTADNSYAKAMRIRRWAKAGVALISPAVKWTQGRYAHAYHRFIHQSENQQLLRTRRTAIEPIFDLVAKLIGATDNHKQLAIQGLQNVRTHLTLAVFALQVAMIANSIWGMPLRTISHMMSALS